MHMSSGPPGAEGQQARQGEMFPGMHAELMGDITQVLSTTYGVPEGFIPHIRYFRIGGYYVSHNSQTIDILHNANTWIEVRSDRLECRYYDESGRPIKTTDGKEELAAFRQALAEPQGTPLTFEVEKLPPIAPR